MRVLAIYTAKGGTGDGFQALSGFGLSGTPRPLDGHGTLSPDPPETLKGQFASPRRLLWAVLVNKRE